MLTHKLRHSGSYVTNCRLVFCAVCDTISSAWSRQDSLMLYIYGLNSTAYIYIYRYILSSQFFFLYYAITYDACYNSYY